MVLKLNNLKEKLKVIILNFLFRNHLPLLNYTTKSIYENLIFLKKSLVQKGTCLNFILTSKAEIRVFLPLIKYLDHNSNFTINIVCIKNDSFSEDSFFEDFKVNRGNLTFSTIPLIFSINKYNHLNLICLDFINEKAHTTGTNIMQYLKKNNAKTICFQHGGSQKDNIIGQSNSASFYQVVYGGYIYDSLIKLGINKERIFLTGNALHDDIICIDTKIIKNRLKSDGFNVNKKIILVATCLFFEYDDRENPNDLYKLYIQTIYKSIDFDNFSIIVKMHPNDKLSPNLYLDNDYTINRSNDFKVILPNDNTFTFYELAQVSDIIISRSSTTIEEGVMLGKKVIAFDLFDDGPSRHLEHLKEFPSFKKVLLKDKTNLKTSIYELLDKEISKSKINEAVDMFTYRLDGKSKERIKNTLQTIIDNN